MGMGVLPAGLGHDVNQNYNKAETMKKILLLLLLSGCNTKSNYEVRYSPDGKDSVAHILYYDGQQFNRFYIPFPAFKTVFESGGYEGCYEYYLENELPIKVRSKYDTYK